MLILGICPAEWNRPRKRLCVILVTENTNTHDEARDALRKIALESAFSAERVRFAYIYQVKIIYFSVVVFFLNNFVHLLFRKNNQIL